jgi:predicted small secreted protein
MKLKNLINQLLFGASFTLAASNTMVQAGGDCPPPGEPSYPVHCKTANLCCMEGCQCSFSGCGSGCSDLKSTSIGLPPGITPADIFDYAQTGSHPNWNVTRQDGALIPTSATDIEVASTDNLGDGRFQVNYTVKGTPQSAIIMHK